jgi:hypothetical protein
MKGKRVLADINSAEVDELRKSHHRLMLVLRNLCSLGAAAADLAELQAVLLAVADNFDSGVDADGTGYTGTNLPLAGVVPTPKSPAKPDGFSSSQTVVLAEADL